MNKKNYILLFLIAQFLDILTTIIGIKNYGMIEVNPILNNFLLNQFIAIKIIIVIAITIYFWKRKRKIPNWYFITIIIISSIAPFLNGLQIFLIIKEVL